MKGCNPHEFKYFNRPLSILKSRIQKYRIIYFIIKKFKSFHCRSIGFLSLGTAAFSLDYRFGPFSARSCAVGEKSRSRQETRGSVLLWPARPLALLSFRGRKPKARPSSNLRRFYGHSRLTARVLMTTPLSFRSEPASDRIFHV
jgi:hypothetical protein